MTERLGLVLLVIVVAGCTTPGEPPHHPDPGAYQDVMRRELATTASALATAHLTLSYAARDQITGNYAITLLHQSRADLAHVATDLAQIRPPPAFAHAHHRLFTLTTIAAQNISMLVDHWPDARAIHRALRQEDAESTTADRLDTLLQNG